MGLINCPDCGKDISDNSSACIHCGCPISQKTEEFYFRMTNFSKKSRLLGVGNFTGVYSGFISKNDFVELYDCNSTLLGKIKVAQLKILKSNTIQIVTDAIDKSIFEATETIVKKKESVSCPKCGCTQIEAVNKKFSLVTGLATNKVQRVCLNCKHKF